MIAFVFDRVRLAFDSLLDNKRRTVLSLLGITVGIAAVITVGSVSRSANGVVYKELESFGLASIWISRDYRSGDPDKRVVKGTGITLRDYAAIKENCCRNVEQLTAISLGHGRTAVQRANSFSNATVQGVDVAHLAVANDVLTSGRFIRRSDVQRKRRVAVLAPKAKRDLFATAGVVVGQTIRINGQKYTVIGLLADKSRDFLSSIGSVRNDENNRVLVPYTTYHGIFATSDISYLQAKATSLDLGTVAGDEIISRLRRLTRERFAYRNETMHEYIRTAERILGAVEVAGIIAASISLLVAGMGIANIMGTAVVERTREIGLRKALGARARDIQLHFLLEAIIVSLLGAALGTLLGLSLVYVLSQVTGISALGTLEITAVALVSSVVVGVVAGFLPSRRAARLDPVTALRYE